MGNVGSPEALAESVSRGGAYELGRTAYAAGHVL